MRVMIYIAVTHKCVRRFISAAMKFKRAARLCMDDNLLKFRTPMYHLNCLLCLLADLHLEDARNYVVQQLDDYTFQTSREKRFAMDVLYCIQEVDPDLLVDHIWNYDYVVELSFRQLMLLEIIMEAVKATRAQSKKSTASDTVQEAMQKRVDAMLAEEKSDSGSSWGSDEESSSEDEAPAAAAGAAVSPGSQRRGSVVSASMGDSVHS